MAGCGLARLPSLLEDDVGPLGKGNQSPLDFEREAFTQAWSGVIQEVLGDALKPDVLAEPDSELLLVDPSEDYVDVETLDSLGLSRLLELVGADEGDLGLDEIGSDLSKADREMGNVGRIRYALNAWLMAYYRTTLSKLPTKVVRKLIPLVGSCDHEVDHIRLHDVLARAGIPRPRIVQPDLAVLSEMLQRIEVGLERRGLRKGEVTSLQVRAIAFDLLDVVTGSFRIWEMNDMLDDAAERFLYRRLFRRS